MRKSILFLVVSVLLSVVIAVSLSLYILAPSGGNKAINSAKTIVRNIGSSSLPDFVNAAESAVDGVVFVKVIKREKAREATILDYFFGGGGYSQPRERVGSGSGVIISSDGYIVTNNHVVADGTEVEVTLTNNKSYRAKIVGTDPVTDVALLKVEAEDLPALTFGSSDNLRLGEWVLAIGSPFNLRSTVTAGIVSAKGRSLPDMEPNKFKIESFIQTDAAVNPGNSGGALVNTSGEVVGINTAIASNTGSYTGYSFAVPSSIVKKVVNDIKEYGVVQRAILGISMAELNDKLAELANLPSDYKGVFVVECTPGGAADVAGLKSEDVIIAIDGKEVNSPSEVQQVVNNYKPTDTINIKILRKGAEKDLAVTFKNKSGATALSGNGDQINLFGATLQQIPETISKKLRISKGVEVKNLSNGKFKAAGIREGFIITHINQMPVSTPQEVVTIINNAERGILVEGVYSNGKRTYYGIGL